MAESSEDDTFIRLKRMSIHEMAQRYLNKCWNETFNNAKFVEWDKFFREHGWTWESFYKECERNFINISFGE